MILRVSLMMLTVVCLAVPATSRAAVSKYSIVLASSPAARSNWSIDKHPLFEGRYVYISRIHLQGKDWQRLNIGFYDDRKQASVELNRIRSLYSDAWLHEVSQTEIEQAEKSHLYAPAKTVLAAAGNVPVSQDGEEKISGMTDENLQKIMRDAKSAYKKQDYSKAIRLFSAVISAGDSAHSQEALELLGLSRQRNGQKAHAASIYRQYLQSYPDSEGANRVLQRLNGLMTETTSRKQDVNMAADEEQDDPGVFLAYGSISQYYRHDQISIDGVGDSTRQSLLSSYADATAIYRKRDTEHTVQAVVSNNYDFIEDRDTPSTNRIYEMYYQASSRNNGNFLKLGRQKLRVGAALNRFDGLALGYQISPDYHITLLGGAPVEIDNKTSINDHKVFYGLVFDTGTFLRNWNANLFHFHQTVDGINDRTDTGVELFYRDAANLFYGLVDYESQYNVINTININANTQLSQDLSLHMTAYMLQTPLMSTSNALIGQSVTSIEELQKTMNIEQIRQLARDRTSKSQTATVGATKQLNKNYQVNIDITAASNDGTVASGGVAAQPSTGTNTFLSGQLVANSLFTLSDTIVFGFRYYQTNLSDTTTLLLNTRFPITRLWRINPRLQLDHRERSSGGAQDKVRLYLKTDYTASRKARFDFEIGYDDVSDDTNNQDLNSNSLYYMLGYRLDF